MYKTIYIVTLFVCQSLMAMAQEALPVGARSWSLGNASATHSDVWSTMNNQAGLGKLKQTSIGIYAENLYLLKDLSRGSFAVAMPTKSGTVGLGINTWGGAFNRQQFGLAYGKVLAKTISIGVKLNYIVTNQPENYGKTRNFLVEAGIQYEATKNMVIGLHIYNPNEVVLSQKLNESLPGIYKMGIGYKFSEKVNATVEGINQTNLGFSFRSGLEYKPVEKYQFRMGLSTNPLNMGFGLGYTYKMMKIDMSANYHTVLGFSPRLSMVVDLGKK